ncbi:glb-25, partial [Pristionchus pacificus]
STLVVYRSCLLPLSSLSLLLMGSGSSSSGRPSPSPVIPLKGSEQPEAAAPECDSRLPFSNFRELFTLKNYWKTVKRNDVQCGKTMLAKYLSEQVDNKGMYSKLGRINGIPPPDCTDPAFEATAAAYLKVFDDVITAVEEKPGDVQGACDRLSNVGKMHRTKVSGMDSSAFQAMEGPFLFMIQEILQDRFNEKAETLFRKFFQFCLKYLIEGFNK